MILKRTKTMPFNFHTEDGIHALLQYCECFTAFVIFFFDAVVVIFYSTSPDHLYKVRD